MRQFVIIGHDAPTTPTFSLDDIPGAGRLDVLCRCVTSAFFLSHDIRTAVQVSLVLDDTFTVRFDGRELKRLNPDERSTAALIRTALEASDGAIGAMEANPAPGIYIGRRGLTETLKRVAAEGTLLQLHEEGDPAVDLDPPQDSAFVLSDHRDFTSREADLLTDLVDARVRVGPKRLHADHAITIAHNWLDTAGYTSY